MEPLVGWTIILSVLAVVRLVYVLLIRRKGHRWKDVQVVNDYPEAGASSSGMATCPECSHYPCRYRVINENHPKGQQIVVDCIECCVRGVPEEDRIDFFTRDGMHKTI